MKNTPYSHLGYNNKYELIFSYLYSWGITFLQAKYLYDASIPMRSNPSSLKPAGAQNFLPRRWFSMRIDLSDWQWVTFDYHFTKQVIFALIYVSFMQCFKHFIRWIFRKRLTVQNEQERSENVTKCVKNITDVYLMINFAFCFYMHGTSTLFMLFIMLITYCISMASYQYKYSNLIAWTWNLVVGIIVSKYDHSYFAFRVLVHPSLKWLDFWIPVNMRWNQTYRLTMLRCISFHMDLRRKYLKQKLYKCRFNDVDYKDYVQRNDFSIINFYAYTLYTPLLISGPIMSFYEWMNQLKCTLSYDLSLNMKAKSPYIGKELSLKYVAVYLARFVFTYFVFQVWLHFIWTSAFIKYGFPNKLQDLHTTQDYQTYMIVLCSFGFMHLAFIWMKFLIIWRFARLWALLDGIVTTENMQSCYAMTTQISQFWKHWHSSFYLWNKRYIYIPLGGSKHCALFGSAFNAKFGFLRYLNILIVFAFTALWHGDFGASLLIWGSLMGIGIIPELVLSRWYWKTNITGIVYVRNHSYLNRYVHAFFGGLNDVILISANMIGYGPGFSVIIDIWKTLLSSSVGWYILLWGFSWTTIGNLMIIHIKSMQSKDAFASVSIFAIDRKEVKRKALQD